MKNLYLSGSRLLTVVLIGLICVIGQQMYANDYLERQKHYMVYSAGADHIHFKVPVWAYGRAYDYYLDGATRIFYVKNGNETLIANVQSDRYDENEKDTDKGTAYFRLEHGQGSATVTSMANGAPYYVSDNGAWTPQLIVVQREDDDCPQVTFLEFDWYPPASLFGKGNITIKMDVRINRSKSGEEKYRYTWDFGLFDPGNTLMTPQLFAPFLYALNENGVTGYGNAGVPYALYYEPKNYTTSLSSNIISLGNSERSGNLFVMTSDTVIEQFSANFNVKYNAAGDTVIQKSTAVDIPPYHRIYDFQATEEQDQTGTYTGNNKLEWTIRNPQLKDLVDGDYFELQRALKSDFSDAQTLSVIPMRRMDDNGTYSYTDMSRETWTGNATIHSDTVPEDKVGLTVKTYLLRTADNKPLCTVDVDFFTNMVLQPAVPVYYRVRRASSAVWGWEGHEFMRSIVMNKHNFLAPLAATQAPYTLDADYANNHKVYFRIKLDNAEVSQFTVPAKEEFNLSYSNVKQPVEDNQQVLLTVVNPYPQTQITVADIDNGTITTPTRTLNEGTHTFSVQSGSRVTLKYPSYTVGSSVYKWNNESFDVFHSSTLTINKEEGPWHTSGSCSYNADGPTLEVLQEAFNRVYNHLRDSLYAEVSANIIAAGSQLGRCMWDQSARLTLLRTAEETGQTLELIIPSDSIRRQADGSWIASFTDVPVSACTHYRYAARIDQSTSDLRLYNPDEQLKPVPITGPELYYDEGATIDRFTATRGLTTDYLKQGVLLNWTASSANVDEYCLLRLPKNSDKVPDTLYTGIANTYLDRTAVPEVHYEYTVTAIYQCNSKRTANSATTEGWRTPFGEIRGSILMTDNSGVAGVEVALQTNGTTVRSVITKADGVFRFDSLTYDFLNGTDYAIVPTSQYGRFGFNYTSTPSATVRLTTQNPLATDINFQSTNPVRLTGRVLYKGTTIPVAGAMFLLNGDTLRRGSAPLTTGIDGSFELTLIERQPYSLQVFKQGHTFEGNGVLEVQTGSSIFALDKALDGVRFYDMTKVRLIGRVAGGNDQRDLPEGFGLGTNNLGDNLQLVLQLEGDNTAQLVHDPDDLTRDTMMQQIGNTGTLFAKKRITIHPDPQTGEYAVDLFPVKYKVVQATATGYATLFAPGQGSETFDLTTAPLDTIDAVYFAEKDSVLISHLRNGEVISNTSIPVGAPRGTLRDRQSVTCNAIYDRIYHNPVQVHLTQLVYGMPQQGLGEPTMQVSTMTNDGELVPLYTPTVHSNGNVDVHYLLGYPLFLNKHNYEFTAAAYEDYYYNNNVTLGARDRVPVRGGKVLIHNGLQNTGRSITYDLDRQGKCRFVLPVDNLDVTYASNMALRTVTAALEQEGNVVETEVIRGFITGEKVLENSLRSTESNVLLLDVVRNPGGTGSNSWIESGTTYHYSYKEGYKWEAGINLNLKWGVDISADVGILTGAPGNYTGSTYSTSRQLEVPLPFTHKHDWGYQYDYTFTTTERISTASTGSVYNYGGLADASAGVGYGVGGMADVFVGTTVSMLSGKAKTIALINDSVYQLKQPAFKAGTMRVIADGVDANGKHYYLVNAEKVVMGSQLNHTFVYSQFYILYTVMPRLAMERQNLLMHFPSEEAAQQAADRLKRPVYWLTDTSHVSMQDTMPKNYYKMVFPTDNTESYPDEVASLDVMLTQWSNILVQNEKTKVIARMMGRYEGTYSVSFGNVYTRTDNYTAIAGENAVPDGSILAFEGINSGSQIGASLIKNHQNIWGFISGMFSSKIGKTAEEALADFYKTRDVVNANGDVIKERTDQPKGFEELGVKDNKSKLTYTFTPIFNFNADLRRSNDKTLHKSCGFSLVPDAYGDITVSVYRAPIDKVWGDDSNAIRSALGITSHNDSLLYGSYVFITEAGSTFCPYEGETRTAFYNPGTLLNNATVPIAEPEITANTYEITHVQPDQPAYLRVELKNNGQQGEGRLSDFRNFELGMVNASNADGLEVYADGNSLAAPIPVLILPGQTVYKTLKIMRGTVDDYNDLKLRLYVASCPKNFSDMNFSVHYMPQSSPVQITSPGQNWVMNTLSPHDSAGYYLPIEIGGFNLNQKNFDHIEFQYKLNTQSDDMWVTLCSFYAEDSLYNAASGNKALIRNGRIEPFRFYGDRDPVEQRYDLRAVSFCRYGSGFVSKASPVITGVKDTRPPRVFGEPEPVNAILGVGDNLLLRFNESIAGNYLDADNNFQIKGVTNATGITAATSLHFDGTVTSAAVSSINRSLSNQSFTVDMLVRPAQGKQAVFFSHSDADNVFEFGMNADRQLYAKFADDYVLTSRKLDPVLDFTRVCVVYDRTQHTVRFYAGTGDVTDPDNTHLDEFIRHDVSAPLCFGQGMDGNMLEARLWVKALTQEEIAATHMRYLTGYEQELLAYYRMNEGNGNTVTDRANGATLTLTGTSWIVPQGISLALRPAQPVPLNANLLSRSGAYDATYMFWFRATSDGHLFSAGRIDNAERKSGLLIAVDNGNLAMHIADTLLAGPTVNDNAWHHIAIVINRTYNTLSVYLDTELITVGQALALPVVSGDMFFGGAGMNGNIDEFALFEQALPKALIEQFAAHAPVGDEMGLMAYLPFQQQWRNPNGVLELVFSPNDQRIFRDAAGNIVNKVVPLILTDQQSLPVEQMADRTNHAPISNLGELTNLNFDWAFNNDELLIHLRMPDREINKQSVFITVRDVEDLNGNPMPSPVMWTAYVDRNTLKWGERELTINAAYGEQNDAYNRRDIKIINNSGKRHQYTIESLPEWLSVDRSYGSLQPTEDKTVTFTFDIERSVGVYSDLVYLTDENGLSEPLRVEMTVEAECPWQDMQVNQTKFDQSMSMRAQIFFDDEHEGGHFDTSTDDVVAVFCDGELVGKANNTFAATSAQSYVYLTIYGNAAITNHVLAFKLWRAATGKIYNLRPSATQRYRTNTMRGVSPDEPVRLSTTAGATLPIELQQGWNWLSWNLLPATSTPNALFTAEQGFRDGDIVKSAADRRFAQFLLNDTESRWSGTLTTLDHRRMYNVRASQAFTLNIEGKALTDAQRTVTLNRGWNSLAFLYSEPQNVRDALADYYDHATVGDLIKSKTQFAVFTENKRWEGSLNTMRPGQGYLLYRQAQGAVTVRFINPSPNSAQHSTLSTQPSTLSAPEFSNPNATANMTIIATLASVSAGGLSGEAGLSSVSASGLSSIFVYAAGELVGVASPISVSEPLNTQHSTLNSSGNALYFLTIQSDQIGAPLTFRTAEGQWLNVQINNPYSEADRSTEGRKEIVNNPDAHYGTLESPVLLTPSLNGQSGADAAVDVYKLLDNGHVVIIRNGERYDVTGLRLTR